MTIGDTTATKARPGYGVVAVGSGLAVFGLATYGFLAIAGRGLPAVDFAPLSVMWTALNAGGIGLFLPFEQELSRRTAVALATGASNGRAIRDAVRAATVLLCLAALAVAVFAGPIGQRIFAGRTSLVVLLVAALTGMAVSYIARGLLSGNGRFGRYGAQLAVDGVFRVAAAAALAAAGARGAASFAAVLVLSPLVAVLVTTPPPRRLLTVGAVPTYSGTTAALVTLVAASALSQALANAGPIVVQLLAGPDEATAAGQFTAALVVARVPLFAFAAVQAVLLPGLAGFVGARDGRGLRRRARLVATWTASLGAVGTAAVWFVGPWLVHVLFGPSFATGRGVITAIAASGAAFMLAQVAAQVLLAMGDERLVVLGWAAGVAALIAGCAIPAPIASRAAGALVIGASGALALLGTAAVAQVHRWGARSGASDG